MKLRHSESLVLIWRVAEFEARQLQAALIEPTHLLLGLCKVVDLDLPALVAKDNPDHDEVLEELLREVRRLRQVFRAANLDPRVFRRRLRSLNATERCSVFNAGRLRRNPAAKRVFAEAEHLAAITDSALLPAHLLYSILLTEDAKRDSVLSDLRVDLKRMRQLAKREVLLQAERGATQADRTSILN